MENHFIFKQKLLMKKKIHYFITNEFHDLRNLTKKQIDANYEKFVDWKFVIAVLPIYASILHIFMNNKNTEKFENYLIHNLESFKKTKSFQTKQKDIVKYYKNFAIDEKKKSIFLEKLEKNTIPEFGFDLITISQLANLSLDRSVSNNTNYLPIFSETKKKSSKKFKKSTSYYSHNFNQEKKFKQIRELQIHLQILNSHLAEKEYFLLSKLKKKNKVIFSDICSFNIVDLYYFLKKPKFYTKYPFIKNNNKKENLRRISGYFYLEDLKKSYNATELNKFIEINSNNKITSTKKDQTISETYSQLNQLNNRISLNTIFFPFWMTPRGGITPKNEFTQETFFSLQKPEIIEKNSTNNSPQRKLGLSNSPLSEIIQISLPGRFITPGIPINPLNNDILIKNPFILQKYLMTLQLQNYWENSSFDFFAGTIQERQKYFQTRPSLDDKNNLFVQDLKSLYQNCSIFTKDLSIVKNQPLKTDSKMPTNLVESKNHYGDQLPFLMTKKQITEIGMDESKNQLDLTKNFSEFTKNKFLISIDVVSSNNLIIENSHSKVKIKELKLINEQPSKNAADRFINFSAESKNSSEEFENSSIAYFQYLPSIFSSKSDATYLVSAYELLTTSYWLALSQLSICVFLISLLQELYKKYQYELGFYLLEFASRLNLYDEDIKGLIDQVYNNGNIRIFRNKETPSFMDLGGMIELLPKFGEIVWYLKNNCRPSKHHNLIPKGVLLVGPPGTGKTLLVKAIGVEANVPVLIQSGNGILEDTDGVTKLQEAFQKARQLAPSILFIDEMDSIGSSRKQLELSITQKNSESIDSLSFRNDQLLREKTKRFREIKTDSFESSNQLEQKSVQKINALTQLLVEMDGVERRRGFVVFGATNRRDCLDPALIRPGRFNDIIEIGLPNQQKRIEILKLYCDQLGTTESIMWNSFADLTIGCSAADLATLVNKSAIQSILKNQKHTQNSLLRGLQDTKNTYQGFSFINTLTHKKQFPILLSILYYELGRNFIKEKILKSILSKSDSRPILGIVLNEPTVKTNRSEISIFENTELLRSFRISHRDQILEIIKQKIQTFTPKYSELFFWLVIELSGKASEFLFWQKTDQNIIRKRPSNRGKIATNLGEIDLFKANLIAEYYVNSIKSLHYKEINNLENNAYNNRSSISNRGNPSEFVSRNDSFPHPTKAIDSFLVDFSGKQFWNPKSFWTDFSCNKMKLANLRSWFRIHLSNPETTIFNEEILFPDSFGKENLIPLTNLSNQINFKNFSHFTNETAIQNLLFLAFFETIYIVDLHRSILDKRVFTCLTKEQTIFQKNDFETIRNENVN